mmetsp:Transcript_20637/g.42966  ORF Transcript_20637/g.42966 Transcript_20637/m.42966 type:complete len:420 (+) Transcript_20637:310-1569(+)
MPPMEKSKKLTRDNPICWNSAHRTSRIAEPSGDNASTVSKNISTCREVAIDAAYNTLRDPSMRSMYDAQLKQGIDAVPNDETTQKSSQANIIDTEADDYILEDGNSVFDFEDDPNENDVSSEDVAKVRKHQIEISSACQRRSGSKSIESVPAKHDDKSTSAVATKTNEDKISLDEYPAGGVVISAKKLMTERMVEDKSRTVVRFEEAVWSDRNVVTPLNSELVRRAAVENTKHSVETEKNIVNTDVPNFLPKSKAYVFALDDDDSNHISTTSHLSGLASSVLDKSFNYSFKYIIFKNRENPSVGRCGHVQSKRRYERIMPKKNYEIHRSNVPYLDESVSSESDTKFSDYYSDDDSSVSTLGTITQSDWCFTISDAKDACDQMISSVAELPKIIGEICGFNRAGRSRDRQSRRHRRRSSR